jgi:hypothetical protein
MQEVNEHGLKPPIAWKKTAWSWQAIDADGSIYTFKEKPTCTADGWQSHNPAWCMEWGKRKPPKDFTKCLWERPKINNQ